MRLRDCHNFHDFHALARRRLPGPIFNYIDGAADDEATLRQNAASFERCDLVPNGMLQFALKPMWAINYLTHERFKLPQLDEHVDMGGGAMSIGRYFTEMLDPLHELERCGSNGPRLERSILPEGRHVPSRRQTRRRDRLYRHRCF